MIIDLTDLKINGDEIMPLEFGGLMPSALGGATERIERLGDRYMANVGTPMMRIEPDGRRWSAKLLAARKVGAIVEIHQPDLAIGAPGTPVVATTTASGRTIPISGLTPGYAIRQGQWFNYYDGDGQRYLEQAVEQVIANGSGLATVTLQNLLRVSVASASSINLAKPCIEGWIDGDFGIPRTIDRTTSFSFTIVEKA
jgi:hypothetical protein